jgi:hypothetical protein
VSDSKIHTDSEGNRYREAGSVPLAELTEGTPFLGADGRVYFVAPGPPRPAERVRRFREEFPELAHMTYSPEETVCRLHVVMLERVEGV